MRFILCAVVQLAALVLVAHGNPLLQPKAISLPIYSKSKQLLAENSTYPVNGSAIGALALSSDGQSYYSVLKLANVSFRIALDTGSADLWIMSTNCSTSTCKSAPRYPLTNFVSPTYAAVSNNQTAFNVSFADGTAASGIVARETVQFGNLVVPNQAFGAVTNSNVSLVDQTSGLLGLGFPRLSTISNTVANATPFFATLAQQGQLDYPLFGVNLNRFDNGTLTLGAIDASVVDNVSAISWNDVVPFSPFNNGSSNSSAYLQWAIPLGGFAVNKTGLIPQPTYANQTQNTSIALFDIGTSGIYGPYQDVSRLFNAIPESRLVDPSGQWVVPCDLEATISFTFGSQNYTMQPSDFLIGPTAGDPAECLSWPRAQEPTGDGVDWQFGSPFLRTVYSIYSFGINSVESPKIGLYAYNTTSNLTETAEDVSSFFSQQSATVATTLPNYLVPTPTYTTPSYTFNTSVPVTIGEIPTVGLATSTYSAILNVPTAVINDSALPTIAPSPTAVTLILTSSGLTITTTSPIASTSVTLGVPGWSSGASSTLQGALVPTLLSCTAALVTVSHLLL